MRPPVAAAIAIVIASAGTMAPSTASAELRAGAAMRELVPPQRVPLAGYSRRKGKLATAVRDTPQVRALVLEDGDTRVAIASCELLIVDEHLNRAIAERLRDLPAVRLIAATHTHSGPGAYGTSFAEKLSMGHYEPEVFAFLADAIAATIRKAAASMEPVAIADGVVTTTDLVRNRVRDAGPVDPSLRVAALRRAGGAPLALLVSFAAHPTTLGASNMAMSADYPGELARRLEARFPGATCLFLAGMVGDQAPVKHGDGPATLGWLGERLADAAALAIERAPAASGPPTLRAATQTLRLPPARVRLGRRSLPRWLGRLLVDDDATLTAVAIGRTLLLGAPCDLTTDLGRDLDARARAAGWFPIPISFADDYIGYCVSEPIYRTGEYEARMAFNGPDAGPRVIDGLAALMEQLGR